MSNNLKSMFNSNEFDILLKENKLRSEYLSVENKSILNKLVTRLSASKLSVFDIQTARKDFIGMALEAEQRGDTLSSLIGNDMNSFCGEIINNGRKKGRKESIILTMPSIFFSLTFIYGFIYILLNSCPAIIKISLYDSFLYLFWCLIGIPLANYLDGKTVFESKLKKVSSYLFFLVLLGFIIFLNTIFSLKQVVLFEVTGWVPLAVMSFFLLMSYFLRNNYLRSIAKSYNWIDKLKNQ